MKHWHAKTTIQWGTLHLLTTCMYSYKYVWKYTWQMEHRGNTLRQCNYEKLAWSLTYIQGKWTHSNFSLMIRMQHFRQPTEELNIKLNDKHLIQGPGNGPKWSKKHLRGPGNGLKWQKVGSQIWVIFVKSRNANSLDETHFCTGSFIRYNNLILTKLQIVKCTRCRSKRPKFWSHCAKRVPFLRFGAPAKMARFLS